MALKIERVWSNLFGTQKVISQQDKQQRNDQQRDQNKKNEEQPHSDERAKDRDQVERAAKELRESQSFQTTGMQVEVLQHREGIKVRLTKNDGNIIKIMTAEEFLKLKDSTGKEALRGKILDQKF